MIRTGAGGSVSRFAELVGCPGATTTRAWRVCVTAMRSRGRGRRRWWTVSSLTWPSTPTVRPHRELDHQRPLDAYLQDRTLKPNPPRNEQET